MGLSITIPSSPSQRLAERLAILLVIVVILLGIIRIDGIVAAGVGRDGLSPLRQLDLYENGAYSTPNIDKAPAPALFD